jgi:hypothetical protein
VDVIMLLASLVLSSCEIVDWDSAR